jgi:hypothetical protein
MAKKEKVIKNIAGTDIANIHGYNTWITCVTDNNEKFSVSFKLLFELFDKYEFNLEKHGNTFRTIEIYERN